MINNNIKLTQADGKAMLIEPHAIQVIESVSVEDSPAKIGVWVMLEDGVVSSALLTDSFGWLMQKLDQSRVRLQLTSTSGGKMSIPVDIIKRALESDKMTVLHTSLFTSAGALHLGVTEKIDEIMSLAGVGDQEKPAPTSRPRRRRAG